MNLSQVEFFNKYNVNTDEFKEAAISWDSLLEIYKEYLNYRDTLTISADTMANILRRHPDVHSVRTRIKHPEHLIDKIIRKSIKKKKSDSGYIINVENYKEEITDLIGIRVLHLYKNQAALIDRYIRELWDLQEKCTIYYRKGDFSEKDEKENKENPDFQFQVHPAGYRSWHYLVSTRITRQENIAEIQVRTIFEEGWSEIDHQLRYPNHVDNLLLTEQLLVLNRIAGAADEMANSIRETKVNINNLLAENSKGNKLIEELKEHLNSVLKENKVKDADREKLQEKVKELESSKKSAEGILTILNKPVTYNYSPLYDLKLDESVVIDTSFLNKNTYQYQPLSNLKIEGSEVIGSSFLKKDTDLFVTNTHSPVDLASMGLKDSPWTATISNNKENTKESNK